MLTDIKISNFRGFEELGLSGLSRVNLIVGKNNTGKTSLLEAIATLLNPEETEALSNRFRSEIGQPTRKWLVNDRASLAQARITGKAENNSAAVHITDQNPSKPIPMNFGMLGEKVIHGHHYIIDTAGQKNLGGTSFGIISVRDGSSAEAIENVSKILGSTDNERRLVSLLKSLDPRVNDIRLVLDNRTPTAVVDIGLSERVPLHQIGQGLNRLTRIFAELMSDKLRTCFIDEIENGIHYTALQEIWTGLANVAELLNIQIFATTHSLECLKAAHLAFSQRAIYDLRVVQLYRMQSGTEGRVLDQELIKAGIAGDIDLR